MMLARLVNRALVPFDVALTRRSTLDRTRALLEEAVARQTEAKEGPPAADITIEALARMIEAVARRQDATEKDLLRHQSAIGWNLADMVERFNPPVGDRRACPLCGHDDLGVNYKVYRSHCIFGGGDLIRHQCPSCDVIFGADKMFALSEQQLTQEYEWHYKVYEEGDSTPHELRAFHSLSPRKDGVYINYGAGAWSHSVQQLRDEGWNVLAYEPHDKA